MRKLIAILAVLALGVSANAGLTISGTDNADGTGTIAWEGTEGDTVVGMALKISTEDTIDSVVMDGFNVFIDEAHDIVTADGFETLTELPATNPVADAAIAGTVDNANLTGDFVVCGGYLAADNPGLASGTITLNTSAGATVTVAPDALRGGVVALGGAALDFEAFELVISNGPSCSDFNLTGYAGGTDNTVNASDVTALVSYIDANRGFFWSVASTSANFDAAYDLNGDNVVNASDVTALVSYIDANRGFFWSVTCN